MATDGTVYPFPASRPGRVSGEGLSPGSAGGTIEAMEARVAKSESDIEYINRDVRELRTDARDIGDRAARIENTMATKAFVFATYGIVSALLAATMLFQSQLQAFLGLAAH